MADDDTGFLGRWARRKQEARESPKDQSGAETPGAAEPSPAEDEAPGGEPIAVEQLPDIDSLTLSSDFTVFLRAGVPEELRRRALRKLWRLDPVFANLDRLNDYDEDFRIVAAGVKDLKTVYRIGQGMIGAVEEKVAPPPEAETPPAETAPVAQVDSSPAPPEAVDERTDEQPQELGQPIERPPAASRDAAQSGLSPGARSAVERRWGSFKP